MQASQFMLNLSRNRFILIFTFILLTSTTASAANITIHWTPNDSPPEGYRVYARKTDESYNYSRPHCVSPTTTCTITNLEGQTDYHFVVRAYDGRLEGDASDEVHFNPPVVDNDNDNMPDHWEIDFGLNDKINDADGDFDQDGITNHDEFRSGLEPDDSGGEAPPSSPAPLYPEPYEEVGTTPLLSVDAFTDTDGDAHISTQWQIFETRSGECLLDVVSDRQLDYLQVPALLLYGNRTYHWRARFFDSGGKASSWSEYFFFTTAPVPDDMDDNGIPDEWQVDDMRAVVTGTRVPSSEVNWEPTDLVVASEDTISNIEQALVMDTAEFEIDETTPSDPPSIVLGYKLHMKEPGKRSRVTIYLSDPVSRNAKWFKYDEINGWQGYSENVSLSDDRQEVTIEVKDGGFGDADGIANGIIVNRVGSAASTWGN